MFWATGDRNPNAASSSIDPEAGLNAKAIPILIDRMERWRPTQKVEQGAALGDKSSIRKQAAGHGASNGRRENWRFDPRCGSFGSWSFMAAHATKTLEGPRL